MPSQTKSPTSGFRLHLPPDIRLADAPPVRHALTCGGRGQVMKLYRIEKLARWGGAVIKRKHILAPTDRAAVQQAEDSDDCPVCDISRDGERIGQIL